MRVKPATCLCNLAVSVLSPTSYAKHSAIQGYTGYVNIVKEAATLEQSVYRDLDQLRKRLRAGHSTN